MNLQSITSPEIHDYCVKMSREASSVTEDLAAYTRAHVPQSQMLIGPLEGGFLQALIRSSKARRVLEIGCYTGYSALFMAEALPDDGELITLDINEETTKIAREFWAKSPHGRKIKLMLGPAKESIAKLSGEFDLVFIDADKTGYQGYFEQVFPRLKNGGIVISDNCLREGDVLKADPDAGTKAIHAYNQYLRSRKDLIVSLLPIRDGISFVVKSI